MGKRGGRKGNRGRGGGTRGGGAPPRWTERSSKQEIERRNRLYEKYYNELNIVPESERDEFWTALRRDLPNSFRFTGSKGHALAVQERLKDFYIPEITSIRHEGEFVEAPKPVEWYPDQLAWYMTVPKQVIRRFAPFASFQKFLVAETDVGNISRQEVVSMIPPLLMDLRPGMSVLDLCAAPGSKSAQLIEMVHAGEEERMKQIAKSISGATDLPDHSDWEDDGRSTGLLIANDVDYKRAHLLIHQVKRLSSPNILVTNHDATLYPSIKLPSETMPDGKIIANKYLKFDRILADVPCTGDGTPRKNVEIWKNWAPQNALGVHLTQVRILVRALQMLKVGGRVVYSTCSLNPIEDEAVIASAIARCGGQDKVNIVDSSDALPGLVRYPGLRKWKVMDRQGRLWESFEQVGKHCENKGSEGLGRLNESMFPPHETTEGLPLERCMRVYPHSQDTGAFFIAVLEKQSEIRAIRPENETKKIETIDRAMKRAVAATHADRRGENEAEDDSQISEDASLKNEAPLPSDDAGASQTLQEELQKSEANETTKPSPTQGEPALEEAVALEASINGNASTPATTSAIAAEDTTLTNGSKRKATEIDPLEFENKKVKLDSALNMPTDIDEAQLSRSAEQQNGDRQSTTDVQLVRSEEPYKVKQKNNQPFEEPFKYLNPDSSELKLIRDFYDLSPRFPQDRFLVRNASGIPTRNMYYTTALAKAILQENESKGMKFVHGGVKIFVKQDAPRPEVCPWRIQSDGIRIVEAFVGTKRVVLLRKRKTLRKLLIEMFPGLEEDGWKELEEIEVQIKDLPMGCFVLRVEPDETEDGFRHVHRVPWEMLLMLTMMNSERMVFPLWKSFKSLNLMLSKEDRKALLLRLFNDSTPLVNPNLGKQRNAKETKRDERPNTSSPESKGVIPRKQDGSEVKTEGEADLLDAVEEEIAKREEKDEPDAPFNGDSLDKGVHYEDEMQIDVG